MTFITKYESPLGTMTVSADETGLTGIWFDGQKYYGAKLPEMVRKNSGYPFLVQACSWLDSYFSGKIPSFLPPLHLTGTDFQLQVWSILLDIPYGKQISYSEIASRIAALRGIAKMSARAVGVAVGHNPISIMVPCHRVVGADGSLTGYAGGIDKKIYLLEL